jgi:NAD(P)-dependent dehydrogenase (short-subunit alcohol dehydrogenase family)
MSSGRLAGHLAFITGAGSGIGKATLLRFAGEGATVCGFDTNAEAARAALDEAGGLGLALSGDVTRSDDLAEAVSHCVTKLGQPTILVNSAGTVGRGGRIDEMPESEWDELFDVNVKGTYLCTKAIGPGMRRAKRGAIINMASTAGLVGSLALGGYSSTKGAVVLMTRSLALAYAPDGVRVNCVCPGSIDTPMLHATFDTAETPEARAKMSEQYRAKQPLGRFGKPEEVAAAILFLASDEASFVTGVALPVDGGRIA